MKRFEKKLLAGLLIMALLSPLGIVVPRMLNSEDAWGEWSVETLKGMLGYIPEGLLKSADIWKAPVNDYQLWGETASFSLQIISYIFSGLIGIIVIASIMFVIARVVVKNGR